MTITMDEGKLQLAFLSGTPRKFDDEKHGLSHCMKAVDFVVEFSDRYWFIEIKDPEHSKSKSADREKWLRKFLAGQIEEDLKYKYRDTFLYEWASRKEEKDVYYFVLVALDTLSSAELIRRTEALKQSLPLNGPRSGCWKKGIVSGCAVFNMASWNKNFSDCQVTRISS